MADDAEELAQKYGIPMPGSAAPSSRAPKPTVWLPGGAKTVKTGGVHYSPSFGGVDVNPMQPQTQRAGNKTQDVDNVLGWIYDPKQRPKILAAMAKEGIRIESFDDLEKVWTNAVKRASDAWEFNRLKISPFDMLHLTGGGDTRTAAEKAYPWKGKAFDQTHTTRHIDEIGPEDAKAILTNSLRDLLGRNPTQEEIEDFASRANAIVGAHPQLTTDVSHMVWDPNADGPGMGNYVEKSSSSTTSGGVTQSMLTGAAEDQAKSEKEYGTFQAATTVSNWLFNAINSPVGS